MIKTVTLTANSELAVEIVGGCHCCIENRGEGIIYASKTAGVTADSDGVTAIDSGSAKVLRNIAQYCVENNTYDYYGKIYLLSDSDCKAEIQTADDLNFFKSSNSSGGGDSKSIKADIAELQENKADKSDVYSKTETDNKFAVFSDYSYTYSGSSADKKNYYYCISESEVTGTSSFESIQLVLALRQVSVLNSNSAKFGIIQVQGRYDQNGDGTDDNTFTVVNVNWVLSSNIQTDNFFVVYNNAEKKIRLYYRANSTYDGVVAQKIFDDINSPSAPANPTVLVKDATGIATLPDGWNIVENINSGTNNNSYEDISNQITYSWHSSESSDRAFCSKKAIKIGNIIFVTITVSKSTDSNGSNTCILSYGKDFENIKGALNLQSSTTKQKSGKTVDDVDFISENILPEAISVARAVSTDYVYIVKKSLILFV